MPLVFSFFLFFQFRDSDWKNYIALKPQQNRTYFKHWASRIHQGGEMWKYLISRCSCQVRVYLSAICFLFHSYFYRMQCSLRLFPRFSGVLLTILKNKNLQRKLWVQGRHARMTDLKSQTPERNLLFHFSFIRVVFEINMCSFVF